ncbi:serine protease [Streptomyces sp. NPDC093591]|uniref:tetratricopeptide repeat protein n=1 Tax=Streptomyces sp. NPDC093591 TaxID=3366044 RepID=UPI00380DDB12
MTADRQGSGYLLSSHLVLTTAHVLGDRQPVVAVPGGSGPRRAVVVWQRRDERCDAALLLTDAELVDAATADGLSRVAWGRIAALDPLPGCQAIGFPQAARIEGRPDTEQLVGTLKPGSSLMRGRYVLDSVHNAPSPGDGPSPWSGMSGAALFAEGLLIGVVCGDPVAWAHGRVEAVPVQLLLEDPEFTVLVERHTGVRPVLAPVGPRPSSFAVDFTWEPLSGTDPVRFGAHRVPDGAGLPDSVGYVPRDVDQELRGAVGSLAGRGGLLLVTGDSAAGKTRSLFEAMRAELDEWVVCRPDPDADLAGLAGSAARQSGRTVLWLDDLEMYLRPDGLTSRLLDELEGVGCVVLATMRSEFHRAVVAASAAGAAATAAQGRHSSARVVRRAVRISLKRQWSDAERSRAQERQASDSRLRQALAADTVHGVAEYLAAGPQLWDLWQEAAEVGGNPRGAALVAAAVDLARTGLRGAVETSVLERLHGYYLEGMGGAALRPEPLEDAWAWATEVMLGVTSPLIPAGADRWRAFDYLVSATARRSAPGKLPDMAWHAAAAIAEGADWEFVWMTAAAADRLDVAATVLTTPAEAGDLEALVNLGGIELRLGNASEAEGWWARAADRGEGVALHNIGCLRMRAGDMAGAREYFERAVDAGALASVGALGNVARALGDDEAAVTWWRKGTELGDPGSAFSYSRFLRQDWRQDESMEALRVAAEGDHPLAALSYAGVLLCRDEGDRANAFISRAYEGARRDALLTGNTSSALTASVASMALGNMEAGRTWEARYVEEGGELPWRIVDRLGTESGLRALAVDPDTWQRLGEAEVRRIMACLWTGDCMDCGYPLGDGVPALHVDEQSVMTTAGIYHFGICRYPGWNDSALVNIVSGSGATWTTASLVAGYGTPHAFAMVIVNPSLEQVSLEEDGSGGWRLAAPTMHAPFAKLAPFDARNSLAIDPSNAPEGARLVGEELYVLVGVTTWWVGLEDAIAAHVRQRGGFFLVVTHGLKASQQVDEANVMASLETPRTMGGWIKLKHD